MGTQEGSINSIQESKELFTDGSHIPTKALQALKNKQFNRMQVKVGVNQQTLHHKK